MYWPTLASIIPASAEVLTHTACWSVCGPFFQMTDSNNLQHILSCSSRAVTLQLSENSSTKPKFLYLTGFLTAEKQTAPTPRLSFPWPSVLPRHKGTLALLENLSLLITSYKVKIIMLIKYIHTINGHHKSSHNLGHTWLATSICTLVFPKRGHHQNCPEYWPDIQVPGSWKSEQLSRNQFNKHCRMS